MNTVGAAAFQLRFRSLFREGRGYAFPCDAEGRVDLDALGDRSRNNYFYARSVIGRELTMPCVQAALPALAAGARAD